MSRMERNGQRAADAPGASPRQFSRRRLRDRMIADTYLRGDYTLRQIADVWNLDRSTVHRIVRRLCRCAQDCTDNNSTP